MKTIRQLHLEEQREAALLELVNRFDAEMDRRHKEYMARMQRTDRIVKWVVIVSFALLIAPPLAAMFWRICH